MPVFNSLSHSLSVLCLVSWFPMWLLVPMHLLNVVVEVCGRKEQSLSLEGWEKVPRVQPLSYIEIQITLVIWALFYSNFPWYLLPSSRSFWGSVWQNGLLFNDSFFGRHLGGVQSATEVTTPQSAFPPL